MKSSNNKISVQDQYAKDSICFGCGPSNKDGLQLKSYRSTSGLIAEFECEEKHQAFPGVINGGIIGSTFPTAEINTEGPVLATLIKSLEVSMLRN